MMTRQTAAVAGLLMAALLTPSLAEAEGVEITVFGSQISGDYGSSEESDRQATNVQFIWGDRTQLRLDVGFVRARNQSLGVVELPFGPVTVGPSRKGGGSGSGDSGSGGSGDSGGDGGSGGGSGGSGGDGGSGGGGSGGDGGSGGGGMGASSATLEAASEVADAAGVEEWVSGPGDVRLALSHRILGGGAKIFRLDADLRMKAPTADEQDYLGTGEWDYRLGMSGQYRFWSVTGFGGVGWNVLGDPEWVELNDVVDLYAGMESEPLAERVVLSGWLEGNGEVVAGAGERSAVGLGIRTTGKIRFYGQLTAGLGGAAEDFSALFGVNFGVDQPTIGRRRLR